MTDFNDINQNDQNESTQEQKLESPIEVTYEEVETQEIRPEPVNDQRAEYTYGEPAAQNSTDYNGNRYAHSAQQDHQNTNRPYYSSTNEYVYSPDAPKRSSGNGGKVALALVAIVLGIFVVAVSSISAFIAVTGFDPSTVIEENIIEKDPLNNGDHTELPGVSLPDQKDPEVSQNGEENNPQPSDIDTNRSYPTLEQLATPEDAMSLPDIYDKVSPSVVGVSCTLDRSTATGTGIIISEDGYIITNAHVVEDAVSVIIVDQDMNEYDAVVIGADSQTDLAVLKIEASGLVACEFGKSGELRIGELAVAIGNPLGFELYGTMTSGIISGLNRTITIGENEMTLIQTNASINSGNSGGPLIDAYGRVIGITSAKVASTYGEGLGFAIPIDEALPIIEDLITHGYVTGRPMIGVSGENITTIMSMYYRLPQGVYVRFVTPDSPAEDAGIKAGDIIIGIQGESITTMDELNDIKNQYSAGDTITLTIYRDGINMDVNLVLGEATTAAG